MKRALAILTILLILPIFILSAAAETGAVTFDGGSVSVEMAVEEFRTVMNEYSLWGFEPNDPESLAQEVLENLFREAVLRQHADALGLTALTEEEKSALQAEAEETYASLLDTYIDFCSPEGTDFETAHAAAAQYLAELGQTPERIADALFSEFWHTALFESITADISVSDEEIQAYYHRLLSVQQSEFTDLDVFDEACAQNELLVYLPEDVRCVRRLLTAFDSDTALVYASLMENPADIRPETLDAIYETLDDSVTNLTEQLLASADFSLLCETLSDAPETELYRLRINSPLLEDALVQAAWALSEPGDISDPIRDSEGISFLLYDGNMPAGTIAPEDVYDALSDAALDEKLQAAFAMQTEAWMSAANPVYHPESILK